MLRHERQTVVMELAAGLGTYDGLRAQATGSSKGRGGTRGALRATAPDVSTSGRCGRASWHRAALCTGRSSSGLPLLAAAPEEAIDSATLSFLVQHAL